ncbi:MAG: PD-(D/E)XK nuclease family protein [Acidimicrobiales bacterium]
MAELPPHLSPSSAASFDGCPRRWKFKYVDGLREPSGQSAVVGTFAHLVLEHLCQLDAPERTLDRAKLIARERWPDVELMPDFADLALSDDDARAFRWQAWTAIAGLWKLEDPARVEVVATERKVEATLADVPFLGIVDRIERLDGKLVISDYKSGQAPHVRYRDEKIQQVLLYAAAVAAADGELPHRSRLLYLGQETIDIDVTESRIGEVTDQLATTWSAITTACSADTFDPKPGVLCGWCPFAAQCDEGRAELQRRHAEGILHAHAPGAALIGV